jgi:hypothetical protein
MNGVASLVAMRNSYLNNAFYELFLLPHAGIEISPFCYVIHYYCVNSNFLKFCCNHKLGSKNVRSNS